MCNPTTSLITFFLLSTRVVTRLHSYKEVRAYLEKQQPDWLRVSTPRHINTPTDYWPQKVLAASSANPAIQNYVSIHERQTSPNPALLRSTARRRFSFALQLSTIGEMNRRSFLKTSGAILVAVVGGGVYRAIDQVRVCLRARHRL
jgi:hypothetical protein